MRILDKISHLLKAPSFSAAEARKHGVSHNALEWYVKKGVIVKLGRGLYAKADFELSSIRSNMRNLCAL